MSHQGHVIGGTIKFSPLSSTYGESAYSYLIKCIREFTLLTDEERHILELIKLGKARPKMNVYEQNKTDNTKAQIDNILDSLTTREKKIVESLCDTGVYAATAYRLDMAVGSISTAMVPVYKEFEKIVDFSERNKLKTLRDFLKKHNVFEETADALEAKAVMPTSTELKKAEVFEEKTIHEQMQDLGLPVVEVVKSEKPAAQEILTSVSPGEQAEVSSDQEISAADFPQEQTEKTIEITEIIDGKHMCRTLHKPPFPPDVKKLTDFVREIAARIAYTEGQIKLKQQNIHKIQQDIAFDEGSLSAYKQLENYLGVKPESEAE